MMMRMGGVLALSLGLIVMSPAAWAEDPPGLGGAYVLDTVGAVSGEDDEIMAALDALHAETNVNLFVVYVSSFTNPTDAIDWADTTAIDNGLGDRDLLLAVAVDERNFGLSVAEESPLSDGQLDAVENVIVTALRADDWSGAAIDGAEEIQKQLTTESGGISPVVPIIGGAVVIGGGVFLFSRLRKRRVEKTADAAPQGLSTAELDRKAGSLLVQLDDSIKTSEQELGFAAAQFGDTAIPPFAAAVASAKQKITEAFTLRQQLDDAQPDTDAQRREWTLRIIELAESADAELDAQADAFDELRELEKTAPQALELVRVDADRVGARVEPAEALLVNLGAKYAESALAPVAENSQKARQLLAFASGAAGQALTSIQASRNGEAAIAVRTAQASVGQADQLLNAIDEASENLHQASEALSAAVADTHADVAAARALPQDTLSAQLAPAIAAAEAALASVDERDPVAGIARVQQANAALETVFESVRTQQQRHANATARLQPAITAARSSITDTLNYITTRRGGVGESARTRVSEADRSLSQAVALAASDPVAALAAAESASQLARTAWQLAERDVQSFQNRDGYAEAHSYPGSGSADMGGLVGGLLEGLFSGSGGWGGGGSRSGGGWSSGSSSRSSSYGGSSRSSRSSRSSSSGSRRSSGGSSRGRSRGGRF